MTTRRDAIARRTAPLVVAVAALPRWVPFVAVLALAAAGAFAPPLVGVPALLLLAAVAAVLLAHSWPLLDARTRAPRALVVAALVLLAVLRLV